MHALLTTQPLTRRQRQRMGAHHHPRPRWDGVHVSTAPFPSTPERASCATRAGYRSVATHACASALASGRKNFPPQRAPATTSAAKQVRRRALHRGASTSPQKRRRQSRPTPRRARQGLHASYTSVSPPAAARCQPSSSDYGGEQQTESDNGAHRVATSMPTKPPCTQH
jgi:hypothetical protein